MQSRKGKFTQDHEKLSITDIERSGNRMKKVRLGKEIRGLTVPDEYRPT
jgi:hypothetical protein